jgi:hypothetical protein
MWDLWWTKWHWDRFISEIFGFFLSMSFHCNSPYSYSYHPATNNMPVGNRSSETWSHFSDKKNNNKVMSLKLKLDRLQRLCFLRSPVKIPHFYECISASLCFVVLYSLRLLTLYNSFWIVKRYMVCLIAEDECQLCRLSLYPIICHFIFLRYKYLQWFDKKRVRLTLTELVLLYILTDFKRCRVEMKLYLNLVAVSTHLRWRTETLQVYERKPV